MSDDQFDSLVAAHHEEIYRYLLRVTARSCVADDLSQETFLHAFKAYRSSPPNGSARAWLFAIATNLCPNHFRAESRRNRAQSLAGAVIDGIDRWDPERALGFNEAKILLQRAVSALPCQQRMAFTLRKFHDLDYAAIGQSLGCSEETARAHVFQALKRIRLVLAGMSGRRQKKWV
jgi:RNA polymerase sigma-70 factor (ECF subfamily)